MYDMHSMSNKRRELLSLCRNIFLEIHSNICNAIQCAGALAANGVDEFVVGESADVSLLLCVCLFEG